MASVLIVEDENSLRETLSRFLSREGHQVVAAADGREAFEHGLAACPEVLVTDWMLKDHIHGLHVAEALKAVHPALHTILITGFPSKDLLAESLRCGVLQLLEKPFNLIELQQAVEQALSAQPLPAKAPPLALVEIDLEGKLRFKSDGARNLFAKTAGGSDASQIQDILGGRALGQIEESLGDWVLCSAVQSMEAGAETTPKRLLIRARHSNSGAGRLLVIVPEEERASTADLRVRILLDHRSRSKPILPDHGPVVVIERDSAVRRLLVSQIERIGTLCYPAEDLESALKLLSAETRVATVLLDFGLAGGDVRGWVSEIRGARPEVTIIGTGGSGSEEDLLALGVTKVLPKPWRIMDLLDAMT